MSAVRVCVDATPLLLRSAGVKTYVYHWTQHLRRTAGDRVLGMFPLLGEPSACVHNRSVLPLASTLARLSLLHLTNAGGPRSLFWTKGRYDIFHASHQLKAAPRNCRLTATIYDMTCWLVPETHSPANVSATRAFGEHMMKRADGLIAISGHTRDDAVRILGLDPDKVTVIYPGVSEPYFSAKPEKQVAARFGLRKPYALFVGTLEPRKNLGVLLDAWREVTGDLDLIIAGPKGWGDRALLGRIREMQPRVCLLGYVPDADLPAITAGASVFVYPSLYEGFGLPVAQALAAGVPVVTSNNSSLPEVCGGGALLIDPRSPSEIAAAVEKVFASRDLQEKLSTAGRAQAQRFRWEASAKCSWHFFERVCGL